MDGVFLCQKREKQQMMIIIRIVGCFFLSLCLSPYLYLDLSPRSPSWPDIAIAPRSHHLLIRITSRSDRGICDNLAAERRVFSSLGYITSQMTCIKISTWRLLCPNRVWINAWGWYTNSLQMFNHAEFQKDWRSCIAFLFYFIFLEAAKLKENKPM